MAEANSQTLNHPTTLDQTDPTKPFYFDVYKETKQTPSNPSAFDHEAFVREVREENERLKAQNAILSGIAKRSEPVASQSTKAPVTFQHLLATLNWKGINALSRAEKVTLVQADPSLTDEKLRELFGRNCKASVQAEYQRQNPQAYARARELALLLRIYGE